MLGAESFLPARFRLVLGREDLGRLWPAGEALATSSGERFDAEAVWSSVGRKLATAEGAAILGRMEPEARGYVLRLARLEAESDDGGGAKRSDAAACTVSTHGTG